jgi:hypothetical protein
MKLLWVINARGHSIYLRQNNRFTRKLVYEYISASRIRVNAVQQFNQGRDGDTLKIEEVWNGPIAAAYDDNNEGCP